MWGKFLCCTLGGRIFEEGLFFSRLWRERFQNMFPSVVLNVDRDILQWLTS